MIKPFALIALAGALGAPSFAEQLKSGVAMPADLAPAVVRPRTHGGEGLDGQAAPADDVFWADGEVTLYYVGHKHHYEGGEGGEGGKHKYKYKSHYEGGEGGEGGEGHGAYYPAPAPVYSGPPLMEIPCGSHKYAGTLLGAAMGGLLGSQFGKGDGQVAAVAAGTFLGMFLGYEIGASLDVTDEACARDAAQRAGGAPLGTQIAWNNPETGNRGTVMPLREGQTSAGQYCREYQQTVTVGGRVQEAYGTACRQPDGSWQIVQ
jgi:surface antigen